MGDNARGHGQLAAPEQAALDTGILHEASHTSANSTTISLSSQPWATWCQLRDSGVKPGRTSESSVSSAVQAACSSAVVPSTMLLNWRIRFCSACTASDKRCLVAVSRSTCCSNLQHSQGQAQPFTWWPQSCAKRCTAWWHLLGSSAAAACSPAKHRLRFVQLHVTAHNSGKRALSGVNPMRVALYTAPAGAHQTSKNSKLTSAAPAEPSQPHLCLCPARSAACSCWTAALQPEETVVFAAGTNTPADGSRV